jgi:hypothetical protein
MSKPTPSALAQHELASDITELSRGGFVMLGPDHLHELNEMVRMIKPGGRILLIADGPPGTIDLLHCFVGALQAVVPDFLGVPGDQASQELRVSDPDAMRQAMIEAGLKDVTVFKSSTQHLDFKTGRERWDWVLRDYPVTTALAEDLTDQQRETMRHVLDGMLRECSEDDGSEVLVHSIDIAMGMK